MGNEIFEEIKRKYKKSNKYMLYVSYEDIGILIQIIETMNKRKLEDMTFEYFNDYEIKTIVSQYLEDFLKEIIKKEYISKDKIKAKIEEYDDKEMTVNLVNRSAGKTFQQAVRNEVRKVLESLLEKE